MDPRFFEAWFNADHVVLGRSLHPLSLEDALILSLAESPFLLGVNSGVGYSLTDLQLAVKVCSTPATVFLNAQLDSTLVGRIRNFLWTRKCLVTDLTAECQKFVTYIDDFYAPPQVWHDDADAAAGDGSLRAPWVLANATFLIRNTTFTPREVWTMPIGQALWYCATISEQLGSRIQLLSEEEQAAMKDMGID